jgi:serine/threonine protein kinase
LDGGSRVVQDGTPQQEVGPKDWDRTKDLFLAALCYQGEARVIFLDENCGEDLGTRETVEAMLEAIVADTSPLDVPAADRVFAKPGEPLQPGDVVGRYRLLRRIGHGGTSVVYLAERTDMRTTRRYAVKVLASAFMPLIRERYERECEILAALDHPNISRILDKGVCGADWPYLVMDFIEGVPIQQYCRDRQLPPPEIARLFRECCSAVAHIHANGVAHCDLKPNNILVDETGCPKILDFGIARLVEPEAQTHSGRTTRGARPLTPEYASPEQLLGHPLTPSTDIYSLGVVLYELLAGRTPFNSNDRTWAQIAQEILEEEAQPPSQILKKSNTDRSGRGRAGIGPDLDSIVIKALASKPEQRYESVREFERDLSRYLAGQPVAAREPTLVYRTTKILARRRSFLLSAASVLFGIALTIAGTRWIDRRVQVREAVRWTRESHEVAQWLISSLTNDLGDASGRVEERRRRFHDRIGLLQQSLRNSPPDPDLDLDVAEVYCRAGDLAGNPFQAHLGDPEAARRYYSAALNRAAPHSLGLRAGRAHLLRAEAYLGLGDLVSHPAAERDLARAADYYKLSLRQTSALDGSDVQVRIIRSILAHRLGRVSEQAAMPEEAKRRYLEAASLWPSRPEAGQLAPPLGSVAFERQIQADAEAFAQRIASYREILQDLRNSLIMLNAPATTALSPATTALSMIEMSLVAGAAEMREGRFAAAEADFSSASELAGQLISLDPENKQWQALRELALRSLAEVRKQ